MTELKNKKLWLLDMDGTVYLGEQLFDVTNLFLRKIEKNGGEYLFLTNNASKNVDAYVKKADRIGMDCHGEGSFLTSAQATALYLKQHFPEKLIYVQGTRSLVEGFRKEGIPVTTEYDENAGVIVVGYDTELNYEKMETTCRMLLKLPVPYIATNLDWVCPTEYGYAPDCGSMCFGYEKATGRYPDVIGKPEPRMIEIAMAMKGVSKEDTVLVGDRLYTDIQAGWNAGIDTVCVLSGEATEADIEAYEKETGVRPTYVLKDVGEIL